MDLGNKLDRLLILSKYNKTSFASSEGKRRVLNCKAISLLRKFQLMHNT